MSEHKYAAKLEIGYITKCYEANSPVGIISEAERIQDFDCLLRMGRMNEGKKGQKELDKLEEFLRKYRDGTLTLDDIRDLDVSLSVGEIRCLGVAENEEQKKELGI